MKKALFLLALVFLILPVSSIDVQDVYAFSVYNANAYTGETEGDDFIFLSGASTNNIMIGTFDGSAYTVGLGNSTKNNPISVYCSSEGDIYFATEDGVYKKKGYGLDLGLEDNYNQLSSDTRVYCWTEDEQYIYYWSLSVASVKRINKGTSLVSNHETYVGADYSDLDSGLVSMDIQDGVMYYFLNTGNNYGLQFGADGAILDTLDGLSSNANYAMSYVEFINDSYYYAAYSKRPTSSGPVNKNIKTYNEFTLNNPIVDYGIHFDLSTSNRPLHSGNCAALGTNNKILAYVHGDDLAFVEVYDLGITSSSSSSGTSTSEENPLIVDLDGDGEFTQDDAKEFSLTVGPLMWIFMFLIFVTVAMGGRR